MTTLDPMLKKIGRSVRRPSDRGVHGRNARPRLSAFPHAPHFDYPRGRLGGLVAIQIARVV